MPITTALAALLALREDPERLAGAEPARAGRKRQSLDAAVAVAVAGGGDEHVEPPPRRRTSLEMGLATAGGQGVEAATAVEGANQPVPEPARELATRLGAVVDFRIRTPTVSPRAAALPRPAPATS